VLLLLLSAPLRDEPLSVILSYIGLICVFVAAYLLRTTHLVLAGALSALGPLLLVALLGWIRGGIVHPASVMAYVTLVAIAGLCWNSYGAFSVAALSSGWLAFLVSCAPTPSVFPKLQSWIELSVQLLIISLLVHFALRTMARSSRATLAHEARFREVVDGSPEAMILLDAQGVIRLFNHSAVQLSGVEAKSAQGRTLSQVAWLKPEALSVLDDLQLGLVQGQVASAVLLPTPPGNVLEVRTWLVSHHGTSAMDRLICLRDVTEQHKNALAREALEQRIVQSKSIEALGRLAGGVAHDFNNMLTVISATVELMQLKGKQSERGTTDLLRIQEAANRATELTSQLLAFGRKQVLQPKVISPNQTINHLRPLLERLIREDIHLNLSLAPELGHICVDAARLEQVIVNLASNAGDAMPHGGQLFIETHNKRVEAQNTGSLPFAHPEIAPGDYVCIAVRDTGHGMQPEVCAKIFEPFFTTKDQGAGTGLGLAMVHGIVAQSGGHIFVESKMGQGTAFHVYFARTNAPLTGDRISDLEPLDHVQLHPLRILLVEDEPGVRDATRSLLDALGHSVQSATDGRDAVERFRDHISDFDLLVTDVVMPHLGGLELARQLRALSPQLKVLLISGYTEEVPTKIADLGSHGLFLSKPFHRKALARRIAQLFTPPATDPLDPRDPSRSS